VSDALILHLSCKVHKYYDIMHLCATKSTIFNILRLEHAEADLKQYDAS